MSADERAARGHGGITALAFGALGIVFGDIGTSPLYAFRESFEHVDLEVTQANAYGVASIVFWALIVIISIKYLSFVMRAENHGEGGILALTALLLPKRGLPTGAKRAIIALGVFGTALLYGDGLITPAISVLSAVEGFEVATTAFTSWVIPVAVTILVALFLVQRRGTERISRVFSPVMIVWFVVIGVLGLRQIVDHPSVLRAVSPTYAIEFFVDQPHKAFLALGSIFLVVTGGEALYADMGHFGRRPIQLSWYVLVLPALLLNYFGQAALLAAHPGEEVGRPFFRLAPDWAVTPLAVLATMATVIASQALITGAYSLTAQAMQLDYLPRLAVRHTSTTHIGQIYVPLVNWLLMIGCVGARARVPVLEQPGGRLRDRRHGDDGDHDAAVLPRARRPLGLDDVQGAGGDRTAAARRPRLPGRQHPEDPPRWVVPARRRTGARGPDDDVAQRPGHRRPHVAAWVPPDRRRRRRRARQRHGARAGHGDLHVQGPRLGTPGAAVEPPAQPRPARAHRHRVGPHIRRAAASIPRTASR